MATKSLQTNLKLITSVLSSPPSTAQLPLGYMCFGEVDGKASIWVNYDNTVRDIIQEGSPKVTIEQSTGQSTTSVMSQKAVTDNLSTKESTSNKNTASGYAGLDANSKLLPAQIPDYIMSGMLWGGIIDEAGLATLSEAFKSKYSISTATHQITAGMASRYEGVFFIAQDTMTFVDKTIIGVQKVSTGDWLISTGSKWEKVDNTDAVVSVNGKTGAVTITLAELGGLSPHGNGSNLINNFTQAATRANLSTGETLTGSLGKLMKWYTDLSAGLGFATSVTSAQIPTATSSAKGGVIVPASSAVSVTPSGNLDIKIGNGIKKNASNELEADVAITYGEI